MENKTNKQKHLELLKANNQMLEKTRRESIERGQDDAVSLITNLQNETKEQLSKSGIRYEIEDTSDDVVTKIPDKQEIETTNKKELDISTIKNSKYKSKNEVKNVGVAPKNISHNYDTIPLVSNGQCYPHKKSMLPIGYLTAADENMIIEPNMYVNGLIFDNLLRNKILDEDINPDLLIKADRDQIILWLRMTGYGVEFPVRAIDPDTEKEFEAIADLSQIKPKPFKLIGDENGWFDFKLPQSGDDIKFSYPNRIEERKFEEFLTNGHKAIQKNKFKNIINDLKDVNDKNNEIITEKDKIYLDNIISGLEAVYEDIGYDTPTVYPKIVTERLNMHIKAVNGNTDREYILNYINNMLTKDSLALRNYMNDNEPELDYEIELERPESLGGGSIKTFLEIGPTLFFNIA